MIETMNTMNPSVAELLLPSEISPRSDLSAAEITFFHDQQKQGLACIVPSALLCIQKGKAFRSVASYLLTASVAIGVSFHNRIMAVIGNMEEYDEFIDSHVR
mgnify:CR=1 FL=1